MVAARSWLDRTDGGRGQLILVGALGIGLVIIGLVIVINTALVSENIAASESLQNSDEVTKFGTSARRDTREIVLRINHQQRNLTADTIAERVNASLRNYSRALAESHARGSIASVNVSFNNASSRWGTRIVQKNDSEFTAPSGSSNWELLDGATAKPDVRRFVLNVNVTETSSTEFNVTLENASGEYVEMGIRSTGDAVKIRTERTPGGNVTGVTCDPSNSRVLVNLMTGAAFTGDCDFNGVLNQTNGSRSLKPPYERIAIEDGDKATLQYSVVTNLSYSDVGATTAGYEHCSPAYTGGGASPRTPCRSQALWRANVTTVYQSQSSDYWQLHNVSVYP